MVTPRAPFLVSVGLGIAGALLAAIIKAIFDVTVQDIWKDSILPFLAQRVGPWSTAVLEYVGPYWAGVISAFALMLTVEMAFAFRRKARKQVAPLAPLAPKETWVRMERDRSGPFQWREVESSNIHSSFQIWNFKPLVVITSFSGGLPESADIKIPEPFPTKQNEHADGFLPEQIDTFFFTFAESFEYARAEVNSFGQQLPHYEWFNTTTRSAILHFRDQIPQTLTTFEVRFKAGQQ